MLRSKRIQLLENEYWWGGLCDQGTEMPFGKDKDYACDLSVTNATNQGASFLVSNKGRYLWSNSPFQFHFSKNELLLDGVNDPIELFEGYTNLKDAYLGAVNKHFQPSGSTPNKFLFTHPQYNTWMEMGHQPTEEKMVDYAEAILEHGFPPGVLMIDDGWMEDYGIWDFRSSRFNNPKAMVDHIHQLGFKVMLWVCPFVSPDSESFRFLEEQDFLIKDAAGSSAIRRWWNGYSAMLDLSNEKVVTWFKEKLDNLIVKYGIDGFKFDAGDIDYISNSDWSKNSITPHEYCKRWAEIGLNYPLNEYRASWNIGGKALAQRLSDKNHSWIERGINTLIPNGLALSLLGYSFVCPDMIGGGQIDDLKNGEFKYDQELFIRYAQCSSLFPMMQFSTAPWRVLHKENLDLCLDAVKLHLQFSDVIWLLAEQAAKTGEPIIRHMEYIFPNQNFEKVTDQFMLGNEILVAPVTVKGARKRKVMFPKGVWKGDDGTITIGPCTQEVDVPLSRIPYYKRYYD